MAITASLVIVAALGYAFFTEIATAAPVYLPLLASSPAEDRILHH
jgi:hypothetical protein